MAKSKSEPQETEPIVETAPIEIVDVEQAIEQQATAPGTGKPEGTRVWFGEVLNLKFGDGTSYHVQTRQAFITDKTILANLREAAKNPSNKIFITE